VKQLADAVAIESTCPSTRDDKVNLHWQVKDTKYKRYLRLFHEACLTAEPSGLLGLLFDYAGVANGSPTKR
jgi:hypothetical protein